MNCRTTELKIGARLAGELSEAEIAAMDQHLAECDSCRQLWIEEHSLWDITANYPEPPKVSADFTANVMAGICAETDSADVGHKIIKFPPRRRRWIPAVAAAALFVALTGIYLMRVNAPKEISQVADHQVPEEISDEMIIANLDILANLELLENLEFYENLDVIETLAVN